MSEGIFIDPIAENGGIPSLWASIPVGTILPSGINYQILDYLFIPEESVATKSGRYLTKAFIDLLESEALLITGNNEPMTIASKWSPSGRIQVYDDAVFRLVPLEGAKLRVRRWFKTIVAYTNNQGYFATTSTFKVPANYSIVWEGHCWDIRSGIFGQAFYNGPKTTGAWYLDITSGKSIRSRISTRFSSE